MTVLEAKYVNWLKQQDCIVCGQHGPSDAHEQVQGQWFTAIPLCPDCHRGPAGIHGDKNMWKVMKLDELSALNLHIGNFIKQQVVIK